MNTNSENTKTPVICFGEVLWDVLPDGPQPGGAPLNVAYHLTKLGLKTSVISKIGADENGRKLEELMENWFVKTNLLQHDSEYSTSEVIARMGNGNEVTYEIVFPVAWDFIEYFDADFDEINKAEYFVYGSLASRNKKSKDTLFQFLETDSIKVFDINLRPPFYNKALLEELLAKADIVKFNEAELEMAQLLFSGSFNNEISRVQFIQERFNIPEVIVTKGEFGASYYKNDESYHAWGSDVEVKDTIGSGDSFLATFIANHFYKNSPNNIIKNAVSMGAFIATKKGGCPDYDVKEYFEFSKNSFKF